MRVLVLSAIILIAVVVLVLPVLLRFAEESHPGNQVEHHSDDDQGDGPGGMLEAA